MLEHRAHHVLGHTPEDRREFLHVRVGRLVPPRLHEPVNFVHPGDRVGNIGRNREPQQVDPVAARLVGFHAEVDRHVDAQLRHVVAVPFVIAVQPTEESGDIGVIHLPVGGFRGLLQPAQRDEQGAVPPAERALRHHRGFRVGGRDAHLPDRDARRPPSSGWPKGAADAAQHRARQRGDGADDVAGLHPEGLDRHVRVAEVLPRGSGRDFLGQWGVGGEVEEQHRELDAADAVRQGVVDLQEQRGPAVLHVFDEVHLPQGAVLVEGGHAQVTGHLQHRVEVLGRRRRQPAKVPAQVEVGVEGPARGGQAQRRHHDLLPEPGDDPGHDVDLALKVIPVRRLLVDRGGDHRRTQQRVVLHLPREGVRLLHVLLMGVGHGGLHVDAPETGGVETGR